jgi:hypothetical protein
MSKYKIDQVEEKTTATGKTYKALMIGNDRVSIWSDNPEYAKAVEGGEIEGMIVQKGQYKNFVSTLTPPNFVAQRRAGMAEAVAQKQAGIKESQERKNEAIRIAGVMRDATLISIAELAGSPLVASDFQARWDYWQKWLEKRGDELDDYTHKPPFQ